MPKRKTKTKTKPKVNRPARPKRPRSKASPAMKAKVTKGFNRDMYGDFSRY